MNLALRAISLWHDSLHEMNAIIARMEACICGAFVNLPRNSQQFGSRWLVSGIQTGEVSALRSKGPQRSDCMSLCRCRGSPICRQCPPCGTLTLAAFTLALDPLANLIFSRKVVQGAEAAQGGGDASQHIPLASGQG